MSTIESILMEAWELGIKDQVIKIVVEKQKNLSTPEVSRNRNSLYEEALEEVKKKIKGQ